MDPSPSSIGLAPKAVQVMRPKADKHWEERRHLIEVIYQSENCTLKELIDIMRDNHGFLATRKQYLDRLKDWGLEKNIKATEYDAMIRILNRRASQGRATIFVVRKRRVPMAKIERYKKRTSGRRETTPRVDPPTPMDIQYSTPGPYGGPESPEGDPMDVDEVLPTDPGLHDHDASMSLAASARESSGALSVVVSNGAGALAVISSDVAPRLSLELPHADRARSAETLFRLIGEVVSGSVPTTSADTMGPRSSTPILVWRKSFHGILDGACLNRQDHSAEGVRLIKVGLLEFEKGLQTTPAGDYTISTLLYLSSRFPTSRAPHMHQLRGKIFCHIYALLKFNKHYGANCPITKAAWLLAQEDSEAASSEAVFRGMLCMADQLTAVQCAGDRLRRLALEVEVRTVCRWSARQWQFLDRHDRIRILHTIWTTLECFKDSASGYCRMMTDLADGYTEEGEFDSAVAVLDGLRGQDNHRADRVAWSTAYLHYRQGRFHESAKLFEEARELELNGGFASMITFDYLVHSYSCLGYFDAARDAKTRQAQHTLELERKALQEMGEDSLG